MPSFSAKEASLVVIRIMHAGLCDVISRKATCRFSPMPKRRDRSDVHDRPAAAASHGPYRPTRGIDRPKKIRLYGVHPVFEPIATAVRRRRIVDQHHKAADRVFGKRNEVTHLRLVANIGAKKRRMPSAALDQAYCFFAAGLVDV